MKSSNQKGFAPVIVIILLSLVSLILFKPKDQPLVEPQKNIPQIKQATSSSQLKEKLTKYLTVEAALLGATDSISLDFKDLNQDQEISISPEKSWIPASTIKSYVVLEAFRQKRAGLVSFDQQVTVKAANVVPTELETDEFPTLREGTTASIKQLVEAMIIQSDNTAYNTLLDILDRRNINNTLRALSLTETVIGEKLNLDNDQLQQDLQTPGRQPNTTTAKDLSSFFELLYSKKVADTEAILEIFKRQKINNMIPALLPEKVTVAHKTGAWAPIYHDGGIVYKPDGPFILTIFTNQNDPSVVAKIAQVAYFQSASAVGKDLPLNNKKTAFEPLSWLISMVNTDINVLATATAATADEKFPQITAADLGITSSDLTVDHQEVEQISSALITPGSLFYDLKRLAENIQSRFATNDLQKNEVLLNQSASRLSEVKSELQHGNIDQANKLLDESENNLKKVADKINNQSQPDSQTIKLKQLSDLHFAALNEAAKNIPDRQKEQFVDMVYQLYQKNKQEIAPKVKNTAPSNPFQVQPVIGTVKEVKRNSVTLQFADNSTKEVVINNLTATRQFGQQQLESGTNLAVGSKVAVIGQTANNGTIVPQFILKNIPKELPDKKEGVVTKIDPQNNTIEIKDKTGKLDSVKVDPATKVQSKDTDISIGGIKAGSQVTVFSNGQNILPTVTAVLTGKITPTIQTNSKPKSDQIGIKATTITVTKNSSGANQKVKQEEKKSDEKKPDSPKNSGSK